eukprot:2778121-Amphidinium_carterae.1
MVHHRSDTAIAAGLQVVAGKVELKPIPGEWVELKLDACYELGFKKAVFAAGNQADFEETPYYSPDVLSFQHTPPEAAWKHKRDSGRTMSSNPNELVASCRALQP